MTAAIKTVGRKNRRRVGEGEGKKGKQQGVSLKGSRGENLGGFKGWDTTGGKTKKVREEEVLGGKQTGYQKRKERDGTTVI